MPRLHWIFKKHISVKLLLMTLLLGQWTLVFHKYDLQAHLSGHACEMCASLSSAEDGLPTAYTIELEPALFGAITVAIAKIAYDVFLNYLSRAPPISR